MALLEFKNIATGVLASDFMVKRSPVALLRCGSIHPGRFLAAGNRTSVRGDRGKSTEHAAAGALKEARLVADPAQGR